MGKVWWKIALIAMLVVAGTGPRAAGGTAAVDEDEFQRLVDRMGESSQPPADGAFALEDAPDGDAPGTALGAALERLDRLVRESPGRLPPDTRRHIAEARRQVEEARNGWYTSAPTFTLGGDGATVPIGPALAELQAIRAPRHPAFQAEIAAVSAQLAAIARTIAAGIVAVAEHGGADRAVLARAHTALADGDDLVADGQYVQAVAFYDRALGLAADVITFDIEAFEANLRDALEGNTVGYAYVIALEGVLHSAGFDGHARTSLDPPVTPQDPDREMYVASHSKTVSAVALLGLLDDEGISVESSITPYLPPDWSAGPNLADVTFRRLLTHRSGLDSGGLSCCTAGGQSFETLQSIVAAGSTGASDDQPSVYTNANYSLLRVLIPQIGYGQATIDALESPAIDLPVVYAALYALYVREHVFEPAGINATVCASDGEADERTLLYEFSPPVPPNLTPGSDPGGWSMACGATGWFLSSSELGRLLAFLRYTEALIDSETRSTMDELFLGWLDPDAFASYVSGAFGVYRAHGGDYADASGDGMTGCMMNFPIVVQASLLINSAGNAFGGHACTLLKNAFDDAWEGS